MSDDHFQGASDVLEQGLWRSGVQCQDPARDENYSTIRWEAELDQSSGGPNRTDRCRVDVVVRLDLRLFETQMTLIPVPKNFSKTSMGKTTFTAIPSYRSSQK